MPVARRVEADADPDAAVPVVTGRGWGRVGGSHRLDGEVSPGESVRLEKAARDLGRSMTVTQPGEPTASALLSAAAHHVDAPLRPPMMMAESRISLNGLLISCFGDCFRVNASH